MGRGQGWVTDPQDRLGLLHREPSGMDADIQMHEKFKLKATCIKFRGEKRTMCPSRRAERCPGAAQDPTRSAALQNHCKSSAEHPAAPLRRRRRLGALAHAAVPCTTRGALKRESLLKLNQKAPAHPTRCSQWATTGGG